VTATEAPKPVPIMITSTSIGILLELGRARGFTPNLDFSETRY
jgi:hypothetical protein